MLQKILTLPVNWFPLNVMWSTQVLIQHNASIQLKFKTWILTALTKHLRLVKLLPMKMPLACSTEDCLEENNPLLEILPDAQQDNEE